MKARSNKNNISVLKNSNCYTVQKHNDIEEEVLHLYKALLGSKADHIPTTDVRIMRAGPRQTLAQ